MACMTKNPRFARCAFSKDEHGVADVLATAFMFLIVIFAGILLHRYSTGPLQSATDRQLALKSDFIYATLDKAYTGAYAMDYLRAAAENFVLSEPTVPESYLRSSMENTLKYLCPPGYAIEVVLTRENHSPWTLVCPSTAGSPTSDVKQFAHRGVVSITQAEVENAAERTVLMQVTVTLFKLSGGA